MFIVHINIYMYLRHYIYCVNADCEYVCGMKAALVYMIACSTEEQQIVGSNPGDFSFSFNLVIVSGSLVLGHFLLWCGSQTWIWQFAVQTVFTDKETQKYVFGVCVINSFCCKVIVTSYVYLFGSNCVVFMYFSILNRTHTVHIPHLCHRYETSIQFTVLDLVNNE